MWSSWSVGSKIDYVKNDQIKVTDFLHAGTNPCRLYDACKFWGWAWSKQWVWPVWSGDRALKFTVSEE